MELSKVKALYNFLLLYPDEYVSEETICESLPGSFPANHKAKSHTTLNRQIWDAVNFINQSISGFEKIILNNRKRQYKVANREDLKIYLSREHKLLRKKYNRLNQIAYKASLDGVADLTYALEDEQLKVLETLIKTMEDPRNEKK